MNEDVSAVLKMECMERTGRWMVGLLDESDSGSLAPRRSSFGRKQHLNHGNKRSEN